MRYVKGLIALAENGFVSRKVLSFAKKLKKTQRLLGDEVALGGEGMSEMGE